jgi:hypothetical protein
MESAPLNLNEMEPYSLPPSNLAIDQPSMGKINGINPRIPRGPVHYRRWWRRGRHARHAAREMETGRGRERALTACSASDGLPSSSSARARDSMTHPSPAAGAGGGWDGLCADSISTSGNWLLLLLLASDGRGCDATPDAVRGGFYGRPSSS